MILLNRYLIPGGVDVEVWISLRPDAPNLVEPDPASNFFASWTFGSIRNIY